jgi:hypothetical protein
VRVLGFALNEVSEPGDDICLKESSLGKLGEAGLLELGESSSDVGDDGGGCWGLSFWVKDVAKISLRVLTINYLVGERKSWVPFKRQTLRLNGTDLHRYCLTKVSYQKCPMFAELFPPK